MRMLLLPFSLLYGVGVTIRNWFFDIGLLKIEQLDVPVISVGNISAGGVGKTPFVELLARRLIQKGLKVAIVSRGYKRKSFGTVVVSNGNIMCAEADVSGDEPAQLAAKLKGAVVVVDEQRVRGARYAREQFKAGIILLDDGFQHRYVKRDLDIVLVSAEEALNTTLLLPAGNKRELLSSLRRADMIVLSRCADQDQFHAAQQRISGYAQRPIAGVATRVSALRKATTNFSLDLNGLKGKKVVAFSGIGSPDSFESVLRSLTLEIANHVVFPDHYRYSDRDLTNILNEFRHAAAEYIVTTEKDIARLRGMRERARELFEHSPLFYVEIEQVFLAGEQYLNEALAKFV